MTIRELIEKQTAYLSKCSPKSAPYVQRELQTLQATEGRIRRLEEENREIVRRFLALNQLFLQDQEIMKIYQNIFFSQKNHKKMSAQTTAVQPATQQTGVATLIQNTLKYDPYQKVEIRDDFGKGERSTNLVIQYYDFKMNKPVVLKYLGIMDNYEYLDRDTAEIKKLEVACFVDQQGNRYVNGGIMLVKTMKGMPVQAEVEITWSDMKATKNGNQQRLFSIKIIDGSW